MDVWPFSKRPNTRKLLRLVLDLDSVFSLAADLGPRRFHGAAFTVSGDDS